MLVLQGECVSILLVFLVSCHADTFRQMVLLARNFGMPQGEYVFIYFSNVPGEIMLMGDYSWKRGDSLDEVRSRDICLLNDVPKADLIIVSDV